MERPSIDWTSLHKYPPNENECRCGVVWFSHTKGVALNNSFVLVAETPCPGCGESVGNAIRSSSGPEEQIIE